jgi:hypothetical protein
MKRRLARALTAAGVSADLAHPDPVPGAVVQLRHAYVDDVGGRGPGQALAESGATVKTTCSPF